MVERGAVFQSQPRPSPHSGPPHELEISLAPSRTAALLGGFEIRVGGRVGLDERDVAALAGRVRGLDVERDLDAPPLGFFHEGFAFCFVSGFAALAERFLFAQARRLCGNGRFAASPFWLTFVKQPFAAVHFGRPNSVS